jgi:hypothetical protein
MKQQDDKWQQENYLLSKWVNVIKTMKMVVFQHYVVQYYNAMDNLNNNNNNNKLNLQLCKNCSM